MVCCFYLFTSSNIAGSTRANNIHCSKSYHLFIAIDVIVSYSCKRPANCNPLLHIYNIMTQIDKCIWILINFFNIARH